MHNDFDRRSWQTGCGPPGWKAVNRLGNRTWVSLRKSRERFIPRPARWLNKKTFTTEPPLCHLCSIVRTYNTSPVDYPKIGRSKRYLPPKTEFHVMHPNQHGRSCSVGTKRCHSSYRTGNKWQKCEGWFSPRVNGLNPWKFKKKIKIMGVVLNLPAKQHSQSSPRIE